MQAEITNFLRVFREAIARNCSGVIGVGFSGGLDSSLTAICCAQVAAVTLYTACTETSYDARAAPAAAKELGLTLKKHILTAEEILEAVPVVRALTGLENMFEIEIELPLYFVAKYCSEKLLVTAQGADELFGGYAKYLSRPEKAEKLMYSDLEHLVSKRAPNEYRIAAYFNKTLYLPFLDQEVIKVARAIPVELKLSPVRKYFLRAVAKDAGVPEKLAYTPKKAAQYSSGIHSLLRKINPGLRLFS